MVLVLLLMLLCFMNPFLLGVLVSISFLAFIVVWLSINACCIHCIPSSEFYSMFQWSSWFYARHCFMKWDNIIWCFVFLFSAKLLLGDVLKESTPISVNPLVIWAWAGLLINAINSIPAGELDGGRISFAIWGRKVCHLSSLSFVTGNELEAKALHAWW